MDIVVEFQSGECLGVEVKACFRVLNAILQSLSKFHRVFFLVRQVSEMTMSE